MTWKDAIIYVLQQSRDKEYIPLHYKDITDIILDEGLKTTEGLTPSLTVSASLTRSPELFIGLGGGFYSLSDEGKKYRINQSQSLPYNYQQDFQEEQERLEEIDLNRTIERTESGKIIKHYGVHWNREYVNWSCNPFKLLGIDSKVSRPIDFRKMRGIYFLYDFREVVYIGQAKQSSIAERLKIHTRDRHANRWNRFSWFGIDEVNGSTGEIIPCSDTLSIELGDLINALEAILIEGIEPRQNRKSGNNFGNEINQYIEDDN